MPNTDLGQKTNIGPFYEDFRYTATANGRLSPETRPFSPVREASLLV
jgi:hypothetical protein